MAPPFSTSVALTDGGSRWLVRAWDPSMVESPSSALTPTKVKVPPLHCDSRVLTISADVTTLSHHRLRALSPKEKGFSVVLFDMCPLVFRITTKDVPLSFELGMRALDLALGNKIHLEPIDDDSSSSDDGKGVLKIDGHLVIKLLESEDAKTASLLTSLNNVIDMCPKYNLVCSF